MHLVFMVHSWDRTFLYLSLENYAHKVFYFFFKKENIAYGWWFLYQILFWFTYGRHKSGTIQYNITTDRLVNKFQIISPKILEEKYYRMGKV